MQEMMRSSMEDTALAEAAETMAGILRRRVRATKADEAAGRESQWFADELETQLSCLLSLADELGVVVDDEEEEVAS
jgi:ribosome assembly protein YihI (activator of Der GTPase)